MATTRTWWKGTRAAKASSAAVPAGGDLVTTAEGRVSVGDGSTALSDLTVMVQGREIPDEAGIAGGWFDSAGRSPLLILADGTVVPVKIALPAKSVDSTQLSDALGALVPQPVAPESGNAFVLADAAGRSPLYTDTSGITTVYGLRVLGGGISGATVSGGGSTGTATGLAYVTGTSPNRQIVYTPSTGGQPVQVTTTGDNTAPSVTPNGRVLFTDSGGVLRVSTPGSGLIVSATSTTDLACFGDSLTEGVGSGGAIGAFPNAYPPLLATLLTVSAQNEGIGGQTSSMVAARQGSVRSTLATAATVPAATTSVAVTLSGDPLWSGNLPRTRTGSLGGIPGTFVRDAGLPAIGAAGGTGFTRTTAGTSTPLTAGALVVFDSEIAGRDRTQIWWGGRNDVRQGLGTSGVFTAAAAFWTDRDGGAVNYVRRKLIIGITSQIGETTADLAAIMAYNTAQTATYGLSFLDIDAYLRTPQALTDAGLTATSQDTADMAAGLICTQLHSPDGLHFTATTYGLIAARIKARFVTLGWSS